MNDRREFLKLFGIGAAIVPIIGGIPVVNAEAKIIEVPKLEIVDKLSLIGEVNAANFGAIGPHGITVIFEKPNGEKCVLSAKTFITSIDQQIHEIKGSHGRFASDVALGQKKLHWRLEGDCFSDAAGKMADIYEGL